MQLRPRPPRRDTGFQPVRPTLEGSKPLVADVSDSGTRSHGLEARVTSERLDPLVKHAPRPTSRPKHCPRANLKGDRRSGIGPSSRPLCLYGSTVRMAGACFCSTAGTAVLRRVVFRTASTRTRGAAWPQTHSPAAIFPDSRRKKSCADLPRILASGVSRWLDRCARRVSRNLSLLHNLGVPAGFPPPFPSRATHPRPPAAPHAGGSLFPEITCARTAGRVLCCLSWVLW